LDYIPLQEIKKTIELPSIANALEPHRDWLLSILKEYQYCMDDIFAIHLAFEEAFFNAVKHGNKMDSTKQVQIEFLISLDRIEITMTDSGEGFDPEQLPDCRQGDNLYKINGRGIFLVRSYMDKVEFNSKGNSIHMIKNRQNAQQQAVTNQ
jgi:serine/threonine-protein kinase RsbW